MLAKFICCWHIFFDSDIIINNTIQLTEFGIREQGMQDRRRVASGAHEVIPLLYCVQHTDKQTLALKVWPYLKLSHFFLIVP